MKEFSPDLVMAQETFNPREYFAKYRKLYDGLKTRANHTTVTVSLYPTHGLDTLSRVRLFRKAGVK